MKKDPSNPKSVDSTVSQPMDALGKEGEMGAWAGVPLMGYCGVNDTLDMYAKREVLAFPDWPQLPLNFKLEILLIFLKKGS